MSRLIAVLLITTPALAQDAPAAKAVAESKTKRVAKTKKKPGVIQIDALTVEGQIQKPEAFYILQRSELNFKGLEPQKSFIPLILKSVEKDPF